MEIINQNGKIVCKINDNKFIKQYIGDVKLINQIFYQECKMNKYLRKLKISFIPKILRIKKNKEIKKIYFTKINAINLKEYLQQNFNLGDNLKIFLKILNRVEILHKANIIHNDLNLENILIDKKRKIYLVDFSEARFLNEKNLKEKKYLTYNLNYSSIENYSKKYKNYKQNDTYSLSAIFFYIIFKKDCLPVYLIYEDIRHKNKRIEKFLNKGLSKYKEDRFKDIFLMKKEIKKILETI